MVTSQSGESWASPKIILESIKLGMAFAGGLWALCLFWSFDRTLSSLEVAQKRSARSEIESKIELKDLSENGNELKDPGENGNEARDFLVSYHYTLRNQGVAKIDVDAVLVRVYRSSITEGKTGFIPRFDQRQHNGIASWEIQGLKGFLHSDLYRRPSLPQFDKTSGEHFVYERGSGGTANLDSGESSAGRVDFLLQGTPGDMVGFHATFNLQVNGRDDTWGDRKWKFLDTSSTDDGEEETSDDGEEETSD